MWIIDLLIDKLNKEKKQEEFEPIPLYIEDDWDRWYEIDKENEEYDGNDKVIIEL